MSEWVKSVPLLALGLTEEELIAPEEPVADNEEIIGSIRLELRQIYSLYRQMTRDAAMAKVEAQFAPGKKELLTKACELGIKSNYLNTLFFTSIDDEYQLWNQNFGVRENWQLVKIVPKV